MSYGARASSLSSNANTSSLRAHSDQAPNSALQARINQKRQELESLTQLRDLSSNLTQQLEALEAKLSTLRDGAQSVALVLANWENVLGVIRMVGMSVPVPKTEEGTPDGEDGENGEGEKKETAQGQDLPVPLVRIPVQSKAGDEG
ncbi:DASH complex subunit dad2 [Cladophialophora chaetospira]|uniref:DASH complex subunit DAD2 n=1 Tax=Cladophialophora chaetospira TaxID=386627 RepID=A0AA38X233_9EURO|nr:DASH complex subunit dad2 [Cladophialophora chaetospira]